MFPNECCAGVKRNECFAKAGYGTIRARFDMSSSRPGQRTREGEPAASVQKGQPRQHEPRCHVIHEKHSPVFEGLQST